MNNKVSEILSLSMSARQAGKTTAICKAAKEINATVICANKQQARMVSEQHGVKTLTLDNNLRGSTGPYLYDHYAFERLLYDLDSEYQAKHEELLSQIDRITDHHAQTCERFLSQIDDLEIEITKLKKKKRKKNVRSK